MKNNNQSDSKFNYIFFDQSIKRFREDLNKFSDFMFSLSDDILLNTMSNLVALKEVLQDLEDKYLKHIKK
jgi:hypothetical protein